MSLMKGREVKKTRAGGWTGRGEEEEEGGSRRGAYSFK
jgi:hypothetical protein